VRWWLRAGPCLLISVLTRGGISLPRLQAVRSVASSPQISLLDEDRVACAC